MCLASGPSLTVADVNHVRAWRSAADPETEGRRTITVNTTFRIAPWADVAYACDGGWWRVYKDEVKANCSGELWTVSAQASTKFDLHYILGTTGKGVPKDGNSINTGKNSGFQALSLAHHWGATRVLLLGFDFKFQGAKRHWHGDHPNSLGNCGGNLPSWVQLMDLLAADLEKEGVEVVNCSRSTALKCFRRSTIEKEL